MIKSHFSVFHKWVHSLSKDRPVFQVSDHNFLRVPVAIKTDNAYFKNLHARIFSLNQYNGLGKLGMLRTFSTHNI